jgi:hypothetical protein
MTGSSSSALVSDRSVEIAINMIGSMGERRAALAELKSLQNKKTPPASEETRFNTSKEGLTKIPVIDKRRVAAMIRYLVDDPSAARRTFDLMEDKVEAANEDEYWVAFDKVVLLLREYIALEHIERAAPKPEPNVA